MLKKRDVLNCKAMLISANDPTSLVILNLPEQLDRLAQTTVAFEKVLGQAVDESEELEQVVDAGQTFLGLVRGRQGAVRCQVFLAAPSVLRIGSISRRLR